MWVCGIDPGVRDLATCVMRVDNTAEPPFSVQEWKVTDLAEYVGRKFSRPPSSGWEVPVEDAVSAVVLFVQDLVKGLPQSTTFVIERQFKCERLVALSHAIQATLETLGYKTVKFVHSMSRFNVVGQYGLADDPLATTGNVKKRSLYLVRKLLDKADPKRREQLDKAPKHTQDDFSDSFLFALSFANAQLTQQLLTTADNIK